MTARSSSTLRSIASRPDIGPSTTAIPRTSPAAGSSTLLFRMAEGPPQYGLSTFVLDAPATIELLNECGIQHVRQAVVTTARAAEAAAARLGYPVALKASRPGLVHKVAVGGVRLDL